MRSAFPAPGAFAAFAGLGLLAGLAGGCGEARLPDPKLAAMRYAEAARAGDSERIYALLSSEAQRDYGPQGTRKLVEQAKGELSRQGAALLSPATRVQASATIRFERQLEVARAARRRIELEGELAVQLAEREVQMTAERVRLAESGLRSAQLEGARAVRAALDAQKVAEFDVKLSTERAERLAAELDQARRRLGVQVPADEIVFIPALPVRVEEVSARVGTQAAGTVLSVTDNQVSVDSALPLDVAPLVKPGMRVAIDERALGIKASGVVQTVASTPGTRGVDGFHFYLEIRVDEAPVRLEGFSVRLTIPIESTSGAVLAVPVSALSLAADGSSRVQVESNGALEYVTVTPGLSAGGYVEVTPVDGKIEPGQLVVVGYKSPESGT